MPAALKMPLYTSIGASFHLSKTNSKDYKTDLFLKMQPTVHTYWPEIV